MECPCRMCSQQCATPCNEASTLSQRTRARLKSPLSRSGAWRRPSYMLPSDPIWPYLGCLRVARSGRWANAPLCTRTRPPSGSCGRGVGREDFMSRLDIHTYGPRIMARARVLAGRCARAHARPPALSATPRPTHEDLRPGFGSLIYCPKILLSKFEYLSYNLELRYLYLCRCSLHARPDSIRTPAPTDGTVGVMNELSGGNVAAPYTTNLRAFT